MHLFSALLLSLPLLTTASQLPSALEPLIPRQNTNQPETGSGSTATANSTVDANSTTSDNPQSFYSSIERGIALLTTKFPGTKINYINASPQGDIVSSPGGLAGNLTSLVIKGVSNGATVSVNNSASHSWQLWSAPVQLSQQGDAPIALKAEEVIDWEGVGSDLYDITELLEWSGYAKEFVTLSVLNTSTIPGTKEPSVNIVPQVYWSFLYPRNRTENEGTTGVYPVVLVGDDDGGMVDYEVRWKIG